MNNTLVALLTGVGFGGWVYAMTMRQTGGNTKLAIGAAVAAGLVGAFVIYTLFAWVFASDDGSSITQ